MKTQPRIPRAYNSEKCPRAKPGVFVPANQIWEQTQSQAICNAKQKIRQAGATEHYLKLPNDE